MEELRASAAAGRQKELASQRENNLDTPTENNLPPSTECSLNAVKQAIVTTDSESSSNIVTNNLDESDFTDECNVTKLSLKERSTADPEKDEDTSQWPQQTVDSASSCDIEDRELVGATCQESCTGLLGAESSPCAGQSSRDKLEKDKKDKENHEKYKSPMIGKYIKHFFSLFNKNFFITMKDKICWKIYFVLELSRFWQGNSELGLIEMETKIATKSQT